MMGMDRHEGYILLIANPKSGATNRKRISQQFYAYLQEKRFDVRLKPTVSPGHACDLARAAVADPQCRMVVTAGGDGTVREVAQGLQGSQVPMLIIPTGTENLLAGELGYDERLGTIIQTFEQGYARPLDLGQLNGTCFICVVGVGFDGDVVERVNRHRNGNIDYFDYIDPIWQAFWSHRFPIIQVTVDNESIYHGLGMAFVGNVSRYATGLRILKHADYGDGLLDVCVFRCGSRPRLVKHSLMTLLKWHTERKDVLYRKGKHITITADRPLPYTEVDGDPGPSLPLDIRIIPQALHVLTRPDIRPAGIRTRLLRMIG